MIDTKSIVFYAMDFVIVITDALWAYPEGGRSSAHGDGTCISRSCRIEQCSLIVYHHIIFFGGIKCRSIVYSEPCSIAWCAKAGCGIDGAYILVGVCVS